MQQNNLETAVISDFKEYSAIIREIMQTAWFINDTSTILDRADHEDWDGKIGNPTPYYANQLRELIRTATDKQLALIERLEHLTNRRPDLSGRSLSVLDLPEYPQKISETYQNATETLN